MQRRILLGAFLSTLLLWSCGAVGQVQFMSYSSPPRTGRVFLQRFGSAIDWGEGLCATKDSAGNYYLAGTADFGAFNPNTGLTSSAKFSWYVIRYDSTMRPDMTWGAGGVVKLDFGDNDMELTSILVQPDGKIVCGGIDWNVSNQLAFRVARFNADGTLDASFGNFGVSDPLVGSPFYAPICLIARQSNGANAGKIIVAGQDSTDGAHRFPVIWRLRTNGAIDTSWGTNNKADYVYLPINSGSRNDTPLHALTVDANDKVYVGGMANALQTGGSHWLAYVARITSSGAHDSTFGTDPSGAGVYGAVFDGPQALNCDFDSLLIEAGTSKVIGVGGANANASHTGTLVARFTTAGVLDTTYGASSGYTINAFGLQGDDSIDSSAFDSAGRIVAFGQTASTGAHYYVPTTRYTTYRFTTAGLVDTTYGSGGVTTPVPLGDNQNDSVFYGVGSYVIHNSDDSFAAPGHSNCDYANTANCTATLVKISPSGTVDTSVGDHVSAATVTAPTVTTAAASSITTTTATLNGTVTAGVNATTCYQFEYGVTAGVYPYRAPIPCATTLSDGSSHNVAANITGLLSGYTYHYRNVATSRIGDAVKTTYGTDTTLATTSGATNTLVSDTFTDANGALLEDHTPDTNMTGGSFWKTAFGSGSIQSNKFQTTSDATEIIDIKLNTGFTIQGDFTHVASNAGEMNIYFRTSTVFQTWYVGCNGTTFYIVERPGGTRASVAQTFPQGTTHTIRAVVSGTTITATFDGGNTITYGSMTSMSSNTSVGFEVQNATDTVDNFVVTTP